MGNFFWGGGPSQTQRGPEGQASLGTGFLIPAGFHKDQEEVLQEEANAPQSSDWWVSAAAGFCLGTLTKAPCQVAMTTVSLQQRVEKRFQTSLRRQKYLDN